MTDLFPDDDEMPVRLLSGTREPGPEDAPKALPGDPDDVYAFAAVHRDK